MIQKHVVVVYLILNAALEEFPYTSVEENFNKHYFMESGVKIFKGTSGSITQKGNKLVITCSGRYLFKQVFKPLKEMVTAKEVWVAECYLERKPLLDQFLELNINGTAIEMLVISVWHKDWLPEGNYTAGLNLKTLWIHTPLVRNRDFLVNNPDFLEPLTNLSNLILWGTKLPSLPEKTQLKYLSLRHNVIVPSWDRHCRDLQKLSIDNLGVEDLPEQWPKYCSQLVGLRIMGLNSVTTKRFLSSGVHESCVNLQSLYIQSCNLSSLPNDILNVAYKEIKHLNLSKNILQDKDLIDFPLLPNLTNLDLGYNQLTGWAIINLSKQVPVLKYLNLEGNSFINFCNIAVYLNNLFAKNFSLLERLSIKKTATNELCLRSVHFSNLKYLDMSSSDKIDHLYLYNLPATNATHLEVNLQNREVKEIYMNRYDYDAIAKRNLSLFWRFNDQRAHLTVLLDPIDCDCLHYGLARILRDFPDFISLPGLTCNNSGTKLIEVPLDDLDCNKYEQRGCIIRDYNQRSHNKIFIDCHNADEENILYPEKNAYSINVSNNHIETLERLDFPDSVHVIDLRRNRLSYLNENDTKRLFNISQRRVWLSQNLFVCDCEKSSMIDSFHLHRDQIMDFDELMCFDTAMPLRLVTTFDVCQHGQRIAISFTFVLIIFISGTILLWLRFRLQVKIYLYSKGWCLSCLNDTDDDSDRPYDAFLSFTHGDVDYVVDKLLPTMEGEPYCYNVCVHYRDWTFGDWIPAQIMRSVRLSKRTVIVLSRNFVRSLWGSLEFRYAVASAAQEERSRLLVLVLDDVLSEALDAELQGYLSFNTYLHCDDPWFWEKFQYAMPRQKRLLEKQSKLQANSQEEMVMNSVLSNLSDLRMSQI